MKIVYSPRALRDLYDIEAYLVERSVTGTRNVLAAIKLAIDNLEKFPKIGIPVAGEDRYRLPVQRYPYLVFYKLADDGIFILHVRHGARRPVEADEL